MLADIVRSEYFKKCVEICWHFVIQDPPMYVENVSLKGTKINKDTHKVFTKSGDIVKSSVDLWCRLDVDTEQARRDILQCLQIS
jgi:hypothetical protein